MGYGTTGPFVIEATAPDGRWLVACQAREDTNGDGKIEVQFNLHGTPSGDELVPYLMLEAGPGQRIQRFISADPTGRFLVFVSANRLVLLDSQSKQETELNGLTEVGPDPRRPGSRASFDGQGHFLAYLRQVNGRTIAVIRTLASGAEREVDPGGGSLGMIQVDSEGEWLSLWSMKPSSGKGTADWPQEHTDLGPAACRGPVMASMHAGWNGPEPVRRVARIDGGSAMEVPGLVSPFGTGLLIHKDSGAFVVRATDGRNDTEIVPAACAGDLVYADAKRQLVMVNCKGGGGKEGIALFGSGPRVDTGRLARRIHTSDWSTANPPLVEVEGSITHFGEPDEKVTPSLLIDLDARRVFEEPGGALATYGKRALLRSTVRAGAHDWREDYTFFDSVSGEHRPVSIPSSAESRTCGVREGPIVGVNGVLFDLSAGVAVGRYDGCPLAADSHGRLLKTGAHLEGPAHWVSAAPPEP